jgi:tetratricopeptide (TPR) repeat protein
MRATDLRLLRLIGNLAPLNLPCVIHHLYKLFALLLICTAAATTCLAQSADTIYNRYTDFNKLRTQGNYNQTLALGNTLIMPYVDKLPEKSRISFYNGMAKAYEETGQIAKAKPLYEKVTAALPDYYVAHLALGHIYLRTVSELAAKVNASKGDKAAYEQNQKAYLSAVNKAIFHLEKVQACDPYDENLMLIKKLYTNINNAAGFATLEARLKPLSKNCVDIIKEQ